jgi:membrane-bound lytic murein transglycosylase A
MTKNVGKVFRFTILVLTLGTILCCYPELKHEGRQPEKPLREGESIAPEFSDDLDRNSLIGAIRKNLEYLDRLDPKTVFRYGSDNFTCLQVRESQEAFLKLLSKGLDAGQLSREIRENFLIYRAAGRPGDGRILFTGYYEPVCEGRLTPDETFRYPLYRPPEDLIKIDLFQFNEKFTGETVVARIDGKRVLPYYSRYQIEAERVLEGKGLEIVWLKDVIDVAFLHIQGSGRVNLPGGKNLQVHYKSSNGRPYRSVGRYMIEKGFLSREEMSMQAIRRYLTEHAEVREEVLNHNPSYVFFEEVQEGPLGSLGVLLTPGRSIALDPKVYPRGALGFISCQKPLVNDQGEINGWTPFSRFVLNQDSGGAIKGPGRADVFWGSGFYAELAAGHLKHDGDLCFLMKK